jgi:hypothetical protein
VESDFVAPRVVPGQVTVAKEVCQRCRVFVFCVEEIELAENCALFGLRQRGGDRQAPQADRCGLGPDRRESFEAWDIPRSGTG